MRARAGRAPASFTFAQTGSYPRADSFTFSVSALSHAAGSRQKALLTALGEGGDTLRLTITDFRSAALKLDLSIPVAGKQADFKALLAGL
jgi:hypothetical protein